MLSQSEVFKPDNKHAAGEVIDGEAIIINLLTGVYYSMAGVGGDVWAMIQSRHSVASMLEQIVATYEVDAHEAEKDLNAILEELVHEGLICNSGDGNDCGRIEATAGKRPYVRPLLQIYRDMQDLLALDPPTPGIQQIAWKDPQNRT